MREGMSVKWLNFYYVFMIIRGVAGIFNDISSTARSNWEYGHVPAMVYVIIIMEVVLLVVKIAAAIMRYTETGYKLLLTVMYSEIFLYLLALLSLGTGNNIPTLLGMLIGVVALNVPTIVYVVKRKRLFYPDYEEPVEIEQTMSADTVENNPVKIVPHEMVHRNTISVLDGMYCRKCGKMIVEDSDFCMYCGTKVVKKE